MISHSTDVASHILLAENTPEKQRREIIAIRLLGQNIERSTYLENMLHCTPWHQRANHLAAGILPWRIAFAATLAATLASAAAAATNGHAKVGGIVLSLAIIILGVIVDSITRLRSFKFRALLDMGEDILAAIIRGDETKALLLEEFLDCPSRRPHV